MNSSFNPIPAISSIKEDTEDLIKSINSLNESIKKMDDSSSKYSEAMMDLTWIMLFVALIQILIGLIIPPNASWYVKIITFGVTLISLMILVNKLTKNRG